MSKTCVSILAQYKTKALHSLVRQQHPVRTRNDIRQTGGLFLPSVTQTTGKVEVVELGEGAL